VCGDGKKEGVEECDGSDLGDATCASETGKDGATGELSCDKDCKLDSSKCAWCGDGVKSDDEECDPAGFVAPECESKVGEVTCTSACKLDSSGCKAPTCTDTVKNGDETDADCGGGCPLTCDNSKGCGGPADCHSASCASGTCADATACSSTCTGGNCVGGRCLVAGAPYREPKLTVPPCPDGWTAIGNHGCFLRPAGTKSWYEAFKDCRARGANLAILPSTTALNDVGKDAAGGNLTSTSSPRVWAGFTCVNGSCATKGNWYWLDQTPVQDNWGQQGPSASNLCGSLRLRESSNVGTASNGCTNALAYLCQL
jgi:hypothetical protein